MTYIQPLLLVFLAVLLAGLAAARFATGRKAAICGAIGLLLISLPPFDWLFGLPLEAGYPVRSFTAPPGVQAIVVLGSSVQPPEFERPYALPDEEMFTRCEHAAWIYRQWGPFPVVACEGITELGPAASAMRDLLRRAGVPEDRIWIEKRSRSTHENAVNGARILREHGWKRIVLVVDSQSMLRASACFRKEGIDVIPAPSVFRTFGPWAEEVLPNWQSVRRNEITLHEMVGLVWYRLRGWI